MDLRTWLLARGEAGLGLRFRTTDIPAALGLILGQDAGMPVCRMPFKRTLDLTRRLASALAA